MKFLITLAVLSTIALSNAHHEDHVVLFDFQDSESTLKGWYERSDVQFNNGVGASKADLVILENDSTKEAVFFAIANAADYSFGRAVSIIEGSWDLSAYSTIQINCRSIYSEGIFYLAFRNNGVVDGPVYVAEFKPTSEFSTIEVPISAFEIPNTTGAVALDTSAITSVAIALQATTGEINSGVLEIRWIGAY